MVRYNEAVLHGGNRWQGRERARNNVADDHEEGVVEDGGLVWCLCSEKGKRIGTKCKKDKMCHP